ncbi:MAG: formate transporter FocA [Candidatus Accumulibacter sp.]|jgi:formate transporter|nr:formate transporter FocA [Accumulibacter sp.]
MSRDTASALFSPHEMARIAEDTAIHKTLREPGRTFCLAIVAGAFIALGFIFYITVTTGNAQMPYGLIRLAGGVCFSLGLILIIVCGGDLFTSTVLTIVAKASGRISCKQMLANWGNVYLGNFLGALLCVALIWFSGQSFAARGQWGLNVLQIADYKLQHGFVETFFLGILANLMVCLAVWMSYSGRTLLDKCFIVLLPIGMFVASGFEHCVANMFLIPLAIVIRFFSTETFWLAIGYSADQFFTLNTGNFLNNLSAATLGNIVGGGLLVGWVQWSLHTQKQAQRHDQ